MKLRTSFTSSVMNPQDFPCQIEQDQVLGWAEYVQEVFELPAEGKTGEACRKAGPEGSDQPFPPHLEDLLARSTAALTSEEALQVRNLLLKHCEVF